MDVQSPKEIQKFLNSALTELKDDRGLPRKIRKESEEALDLLGENLTTEKAENLHKLMKRNTSNVYHHHAARVLIWRIVETLQIYLKSNKT